jgi:phosphohistidine phosphatase
MLQMLRDIQPGARRIMMVGHNPEIQALAMDLIGSGPKHLRDRLKEKYPTAGLVVINFSAGLWSSVDVNSGSLNLFLAPKELRGT